MNNEVTVKTNKVSLMNAQKLYVESIANGLKSLIGDMDHYQALCGYNILSAINVELQKKGLNHLSNGIDKESINNAIKFAVLYRLNTDNKEVFVIVRNEKRGDFWIKKIECRPQYKGQLKILATYGRNIKKVYPEWIVREGDDFKFATYKGVEIVPPEWTPKSQDGKVVRVVVPIQYNDGFIDYRIAERESVALNIKAQIKQTLLGKSDAEAKRITALIKDYSLEQLISDPSLSEFVNDTYTGLSAEEMIITKLVLNATKRVAIDYESALQRELLEDTYDNADVYKKSHTAAEIIANEQSLIEFTEPEVQEITYNSVDKEKTETPKPEVVADENGEVDSRTMDDLIGELESLHK